MLITGCRWQDLSPEYGAPTTVWLRRKRWGEEGVWERIGRAALTALDRHSQLVWSMAFHDGSFASAKKVGDKVGLTKKGEGTKWTLVIDRNGLPLGFHLESANTAEVRLAEATRDTIAVPRPHGRPRQRPQKLVADRAYDSSALVVRCRPHCADAGYGCASRQSVARRSGDPSGDAPLSHTARTIGRAPKWI